MALFSSALFSNDIEAKKRSIRCDAWLFLFLYFTPTICFVWTAPNQRIAATLAFYTTIWLSPLWLASILGHFVSSRGNLFTDCYSCFLKLTLVHVSIGVVFATLILIASFSYYVNSSSRDSDASLVFCSILFLIHAMSVFVLLIFANRHLETLKGLILRDFNIQQINMSQGLRTSPQQFVPIQIEVGKYPQAYPYNNSKNYPSNPTSYESI